MKRVIPLMMLLVAATTGSLYGDDSYYYGTVNMVLTTPNDPSINYAGDSNVYLGPYTYNLANAVNSANPIVGGAMPVNLTDVVAGLPTATVAASGAPGGTQTGGTVLGFCTDFVTNIDTNTQYASKVYSIYDPNFTAANSFGPNVIKLNTFNASYLSGAFTNAQLIGKLISEYAAVPNNVPPSAVNNESMGLQLAIWSILTGQSVNTATAGSIGFPGGSDLASVIADANGFLSVSSLTAATPVYADVEAIVTPGEQVQGIAFDLGGGGGNVPGTPEPAGLVALASLGLCGLPIVANVGFRRRRKVA